MGWWVQNRKGVSFSREPDGPDMEWGDHPADIFGDAVDQVRKAFIESLAREPTIGELRAGLNFTLRGEGEDESAAVLD